MRYLIVLTILLFTSCTSTNIDDVNLEKYADVDSLIKKSEQDLTVLSGVNEKSDSTVADKIIETTQKITKLETEVKQLKIENSELKEKLNDANDAGSSFRIRAISDN